MKQLWKKNKIIIISLIVILLIGIIGTIILVTTNKDSKKETKATTTNYTAYIKINSLVKLEFKQSCKNKKCDDPIITDYELINEAAQNIYKDENIKGETLSNVLLLLVEKAKSNKIDLDKVEIYTDWKDNNFDNQELSWKVEVHIINKNEINKLPDELKEPLKYTISFDSDGGTNIESQTIEAGNKITVPSNPTKEGYTFVEWQLDGNKYDFNHEIKESMTLKAVWKKNETVTNKPTTGNNGNSNNQSSSNNNSSNNQTNNNPKPEAPTVTYNFVGKYILIGNTDGIHEGDPNDYIQLNGDGTCIYYNGPCKYTIPNCPNPSACTSYPKVAILTLADGNLDALDFRSNYEIELCSHGDQNGCAGYWIWKKQ